MNSALHSSRFLKWLYPTLIWDKRTNQREVYLTFDDGPDPEVTTFVLETLRQYGFKATFFCIGENVKKHPNIFKEIISDGHRVGNHTYNHLNGFQTNTNEYISNTELAAELIHSNLFRPPYGRIKRMQIQELSSIYDIVMWSILTGDFSSSLNPNKAIKQIQKLTRSGSIVVFHDSQKAFSNLTKILPEYCKFLSNNDFTPCIL